MEEQAAQAEALGVLPVALDPVSAQGVPEVWVPGVQALREELAWVAAVVAPPAAVQAAPERASVAAERWELAAVKGRPARMAPRRTAAQVRRVRRPTGIRRIPEAQMVRLNRSDTRKQPVRYLT